MKTKCQFPGSETMLSKRILSKEISEFLKAKWIFFKMFRANIFSTLTAKGIFLEMLRAKNAKDAKWTSFLKEQRNVLTSQKLQN